MIDDLVEGELPKSPSIFRPTVVGAATRPTAPIAHTPQS